MSAKRRLSAGFLITLVILVMLMVVPALAAPLPSSWGPAASLESIPGSSNEVNTAFLDGCPMLSRDGLKLYMASDRPGGQGGLDIWVGERSTLDSGFGTPVNMGAPINSEYNDFCPSPVRHGKRFLFVSNRPGGCGGSDVYLTRYHRVRGWEEPVNLGCEVNSSADEAGPVLSFAEPGGPTLYFSSTRAGGLGGTDLYMSKMIGDWSFGPATLVPDVNSAADDIQPSLSRNGRELVFASNRPGSLGFDIWSAVRDSVKSAWSEPINLGPTVNSEANETRPSLSWDGYMLLFGSTRPGEGVSDIYYSIRD